MRPVRILVAVVSLLALPLASVAHGQDSAAPAPQAGGADRAVTWGAGATLTSAFVWRGFVLENSPCVQPSVSVSFAHFTASSWVNLITHGASQVWSEHDLGISYARDVDDWEFSAGYTQYYFPTVHDAHMSHEFYVGAAYSGPLNPFVKVFHDVKVGDGTYVSTGVSQELPLGKSKWSVTPAVTLGYNNHQWVAGSGWSDLNLGVAVSLPPGNHVDVTGSINYSKSLRSEWFPSRAYVSLTVAVH